MARVKYYDPKTGKWEYADSSFSVGNGTDSGGNADYVGVEPAYEDIPKVFFGGALQQTKDEAVVPFRYISKTDDFSGYAEIKAQGNSSMSYPKKNQTVKMFADEACDSKMKKDFQGWGKQNKHVYKANWIDLTHARNVVSARLWADVVKSRPNYAELPELLRTSPNQGAVDGFPVKVYADGVYQGRYTLNIPKDKWAFNMDDELDEHCVLCGENYYSGCFRAAAKIDESDWTDEIHDVVPASIKTRWNEVISFVMNSTDEEFLANLSQYFYVDSLIDYYLFGLASCGLDAFGKNQIYATYDGQRWIASMYDMDSTWGLYWNGSKFVATDYARTSYEDFVSTQSAKNGNLLYIRLEQLFYEELQTRWAELKNGALSIENIINRFERFTDITPVDLVKEDYASTTGCGKFTGIPSQSTNNIQQIRAFALARQAWTDEYVAELTPEVQITCTGISLNTNTLTFTAEGSQTLTATVTPDGCTDPVTWESDNISVATVTDGIVAAVANGSATITAYCGDYSASCTVAVSGIAEPVPCTGISLDKTELTFDGEGTQTITATVTPSDTTDTAVWISTNPTVASITVEGNVCTVQSIRNGVATITVTCGYYSASCNVSVSGIIDMSLLYSLPEETVFNGTSDYIDTGVKLFDTAKDFTILLHANTSAINGANIPIFHCLNESSPYPGLGIQASNNNVKLNRLVCNDDYVSADGTLFGAYSQYETSRNESVKYCIIAEKGVITRYVTKEGTAGSVDRTVFDNTYTSIPQNLLLGCYQKTDGTKGRFWNGTLYDFKIYNRVLSDDEIMAFMA